MKTFFALLASLRLAVVLLSLFTVCLSAATLIEARYGARIAQELIYRAWWFALLLVLLAGNVLAAALKKFPWRRHQTGFLVTHLGLLVLLAGGLLTALFGEEGQVVLIDTASPSLAAHLGVRNQADAMVLAGVQQLEVFRLKRVAGLTERELLQLVRRLERGEEVSAELRNCLDGAWVLRLVPGSFLWHSDEYATLRLPWELRLLYLLATPWPGLTSSLDGRAALTVENYYPQADPGPDGAFLVRDVAPGSDAAEQLAPALRCRLRGGTTREFWVGLGSATLVPLAQDLYVVRYRPQTRPLGFALVLRRARQIKDPGSERPAWFESEVTLTTRAPGREESADTRISMNQPLCHGPFKVYQANYRALTDPHRQEPILADGRPVSLSGLAIASDPGLRLKYLGTLLVVLGIAIMFYMRAYFFRASPERRVSTV